MRAAKEKGLVVPTAGIVKGGRLHGWRFTFLQFRVLPVRLATGIAHELRVVARCTPPAWPFPTDVAMDHTHFGTLRAVRGERARRLAADGLIRSAYSYAGAEPPAVVFKPSTTLRARVKRTAARRLAHQGISA